MSNSKTGPGNNGKDAGGDRGGVELWEQVKQTVRPLRNIQPAVKTKPVNPKKPVADATTSAKRQTRILRPNPPEPVRQPVITKPSVLLDDATTKKIARGKLSIEGRLDLHGKTQLEAHSRLLGFLRDAYHSNKRTVLVITGKGQLGEGVLRHSVPRWLAEPVFREFTSGYHEAHDTHGGGGAIYVRIRRHRP